MLPSGQFPGPRPITAIQAGLAVFLLHATFFVMSAAPRIGAAETSIPLIAAQAVSLLCSLAWSVALLWQWQRHTQRIEPAHPVRLILSFIALDALGYFLQQLIIWVLLRLPGLFATDWGFLLYRLGASALDFACLLLACFLAVRAGGKPRTTAARRASPASFLLLQGLTLGLGMLAAKVFIVDMLLQSPFLGLLPTLPGDGAELIVGSVLPLVILLAGGLILMLWPQRLQQLGAPALLMLGLCLGGMSWLLAMLAAIFAIFKNLAYLQEPFLILTLCAWLLGMAVPAGLLGWLLKQQRTQSAQ